MVPTFRTSAPATSFRLADDFTVPTGQMWYVESVKVHAYRTVTAGSPPVTFTNAVCRIWDGDPSTGLASVVFGDGTTDRLTSSTFDNCYRALEGTPLNNQRGVVESVLAVGKLFTSGTYWVEWGVNDATLGGAFAPPITMLVTGGAAPPQGLPFQLCGEIACCWEPNIGANLGLGDDQLSPALTLPFNFRMPGALVGGATTYQVRVCSNGYVWLDGTSTIADFSPTVAEFVSQAARIA